MVEIVALFYFMDKKYIADPFARVMLFDGRKLLEQKQTTITTSAGGCVEELGFLLVAIGD